jgi:hypothetical protein
MANLTRRIDLKTRLDEIDEQTKKHVFDGFYQSRLAIEISMWEKGEAIGAQFRGVKCAPSYRQLAKETDRRDISLKVWHELYLEYPDKQTYLPIVEEKARKWTDKALGWLLDKPHVALNTGESEWFTPPEYIEAARCVMGTIDVDPASTKEANKTVKAKIFYDVQDDGLSKKWEGNVWMNPPYSQPLVAQFCDLFAEKYESNEIKQGCVLINNATETSFAQHLMSLCSAVCFPAGRIRFLDKDGRPGAPLQGQMIIYFGNNTSQFIHQFSKFGVCLKRCEDR